jgi:hypothetical protein
MTNLQIEHLVERWEDRRDVKNQMGKFVHYLLLKQEAKIVDDLWSAREDICYGVNDGWYQGREAVKGFFDWFPGYTAKVAACLKAKFPEKWATSPMTRSSVLALWSSSPSATTSLR